MGSILGCVSGRGRGAQRDLGRMLRMVLWIPVSAALFGPVSDRASGVQTVYKTILRVRPRLTHYPRSHSPGSHQLRVSL